ncbi:uncharacterized protein LOC128133522 [Lactuca sativa]|uniref:uncharacterized protein LOC128133522 n=1 Tax=Lactuca sativa TaxID=4236 RepID=UPI0022AE55BF|nr:uncharacterized protein LOC128133522 [Lactuca sativa]
MEDYLNGIDEELWNCISGKGLLPDNVQSIGQSTSSEEVAEQQIRLKNNEKRCMRELRGALPPVVYNYIRSCKIAKDIWITLKEKYQGSGKTKINYVKQCLVELKEFRQKDVETLKNYYDRLNELSYHCSRYGITRSLMEFNLTFIMVLRKEWRSSLGGPLALVSKVNEIDTGEKEVSDNEGFLMNSDDEAPFDPKGKPNDAKSGFIKVGGEEKKKLGKVEEKQKDAKAEKKLKGDFGINCHYYNGANHFAVDCMLRKKEEKKSKIKDEAYYSEKLEEVRAKAKGLSLVAKGESDEEESGTY